MRRPSTHLLCPAQSAQIVSALMPFCKGLLEHTGEMLGQLVSFGAVALVSLSLWWHRFLPSKHPLPLPPARFLPQAPGTTQVADR